ncbi:MAG: SLC26A/SulP transporter family protein [Melioribacteraceae bacterium]|nr:SLC26A/SulP transporter family protein [Melioribacteraceae bacterium]
MLKNKIQLTTGDIKGAVSASIITLPVSIGYGTIAFASLGAGFSSGAVLTGIYAAVFCGLLSALFGGTPTRITTPKASLTLLLATFITGLSDSLPEETFGRTEIIIGLTALCIFTAGLVQIILGVSRIGNIVKYVPQSVISGFVNGIALLLIIKQLNPLLGLDTNDSDLTFILKPEIIHELAMAAGLLTILLYFISRKFLSFIPPSLVALAGGTLSFYLLQTFMGSRGAHSVIGEINSAFPMPSAIPDLIDYLVQFDFLYFLPQVIITGVVIGLLGSMESLLCSVVCDNQTGMRHNSSKELLGQGLGNIASSIFGGLAGAGSVQSSLSNINAGSKTFYSGIISSITIFLTLLIFTDLISIIPLSVVAGIIIAVELTMFDRWTINFLKKINVISKLGRETVFNMIIIFTVTVITLFVNLIWAVVIGIVMASVLFILSMSKSIVRRQYSADKIHSGKTRPLQQIEILEKYGKRIIVIELQGPVFFGSADKLYTLVTDTADRAEHFIFDFKKVSQLDSKGASILIQINNLLVNSGKKLSLSYIYGKSYLRDILYDMEVTANIGEENMFNDTDIALENAENRLIDSHGYKPLGHSRKLIMELPIVHEFTESEIRIFSDTLIEEDYKKNQPVIKEGEINRDLFILVKGSVSVKIKIPQRNEFKRIATYSEGVLFGEVAFLDGKPRTADVICDTDSILLRLPAEHFEQLSKSNPDIAIKLVKNIGLEISNRLRLTMQELRTFEDE